MWNRKRTFFFVVVASGLTVIVLHSALNPRTHLSVSKDVCNVSRALFEDSWSHDFNDPQIHEKRFDPDSEVRRRNVSHAYLKKWVGLPGLSGTDCRELLKHPVLGKKVQAKVQRIWPGQFIKDTRDCRAFRETYGYSRYPLASLEERSFPIAFILLFHQDLDQVNFFLRSIYHPHNVYCLSVDVKVSAEFLRATRRIANCLPNVVVSSRLENVVYAGMSRLMADLHCFEDLLRHPVPWRYVINSPGQQFPLRTNQEIVKILKLLNGTNDILGVTGESRNPERYRTKWNYVANESSGDVRLVPTSVTHEPPPGDLDIVKCSAYGAFTRGFVEFVLENKLAADLLNWSKVVYSPDEIYWGTLNYNAVSPAPGGFKGVPAKRKWLTSYSIWPWEHLPCQRFVHQVCIFSVTDLPLLMGRHELFANKFYVTHEPAALHCLDEHIYNLTLSGEPRDSSFYEDYMSGKSNIHHIGRAQG